MPHILEDLWLNSNSSYLAYINSDILLNPEIFNLLRFITTCLKSKKIKSPVSMRFCYYLGIDSIKSMRILNDSIHP